MTLRALEVVRAGLPVLVQDRGRPGLASVGVTPSGAADRGAHALGQRLLANGPDAAALEVTFGGVEVLVHGTLVLALTGAPSRATLDGRPVPHAGPFTARDGQRLVLPPPDSGLRTYVNVRGGVDVEPVLGSRSSDVLSGVGPAQLVAGSTVPVGDPGPEYPDVDIAPVRPLPDVVHLRVSPGPRADWFDTDLDGTSWTVSSDSNRVGIRLEGQALTRLPAYADREVPSEGMVTGAVQVPPSGLPVVFHVDHPVTGGYPVVAVVHPDDLDAAAQARPGQRLVLTDDRRHR